MDRTPSAPIATKAIIRYLLCGFVALVVLATLITIALLEFDVGQPRIVFEAVLSGSGAALLLVAMGGVVVGTIVYGRSAARSQSRTILVDVSNGGLTVNERPGVVYALPSATLGQWSEGGGMMTGTALHLQSGSGRFILGARDHRPAAETRFGAPEVGYGTGRDVDAWVSASDFDQLLDHAGLRNRLGVQMPAPGTPIRCMLYANPLLAQTMGAFAIAQKRELLSSANQPRLTVIVGAEAIWVLDPNSNAMVASVWRAQVSATPETYRPSGFGYGSFRDYSIAPQLVMSLPSLPPLAIACLDGSLGGFSYLHLRQRFSRRLSWRGNVPVVPEPAEYSVSGADWITLVEAFGLATHLAERA